MFVPQHPPTLPPAHIPLAVYLPRFHVLAASLPHPPTPNRLHSTTVFVCDPLGAAAEAILRKKALLLKEKMTKRDAAKRNASKMLRGKKRGRKGDDEQAEDGQVEGAEDDQCEKVAEDNDGKATEQHGDCTYILQHSYCNHVIVLRTTAFVLYLLVFIC